MARVFELGLRLLDLVPLTSDLLRVGQLDLAEYMGVTPDHLFHYHLYDVPHIKNPCFLKYSRQKDDVKKEVSKLSRHVLGIIRLKGFQKFISLFQQISLDLLCRLFTIPRATAVASQDLDQGNKALKAYRQRIYRSFQVSFNALMFSPNFSFISFGTTVTNIWEIFVAYGARREFLMTGEF